MRKGSLFREPFLMLHKPKPTIVGDDAHIVPMKL